MTATPWLWVVAGVNGAGKTTLAKARLPDVPFINADERARDLSPDRPERAAIVAGRMVFEELKATFANRQSAAWETTLSGRFHERVLATAQAAGFRIGALYVGLASAALATTRVAIRVRKGGHDVPIADIERRYHRSLDNLPSLLAQADLGLVFDNSTSTGHTRAMRTRNGRIIRLYEPLPDWLLSVFKGQVPQPGGALFRLS